MILRPIRFREAKQFVADHHRHSKPPVGWLFGVAAEDQGEVVAVGIAGRPVARALDDGLTVEITRNTTTGTPNACSLIYGALCRAAKALGYRVAITYTLASEDGTSLKAAGFVQVGTVAAGRNWDTPSRRRDDSDGEPKVRWERSLVPTRATATCKGALCSTRAKKVA